MRSVSHELACSAVIEDARAVRRAAATAQRGTGKSSPAFLTAVRLLLAAALAAALLLGGPLVRIAAGAGLVFAFFADRAGAVRHLAQMSSLAVAIAAAPTAVRHLTPLVTRYTGLSDIYAAVLVFGTSTVLILGVIAGLGGVIGRKLRQCRVLGALDRAAGGVVGVAEGALFVAALYWCLAIFAQPLEHLKRRAEAQGIGPVVSMLSAVERCGQQIAADPVARYVAEANPLTQLSVVQFAQRAVELASDPEQMKALAHDARVKRFLENPVVEQHVQNLRDDAELRAALKSGNLPAIVRNQRFSALLADAELRQAVEAHYPSLWAAVIESGGGSKGR
ncbi:MAG: hypothetical protein CHACPFDD_02011 [Phycisphaerae bacterium]|nr:hypothetical protein [Phycisphaerae bacterium]